MSIEDHVKGMFLWKTFVDDVDEFSSQVIILIIYFVYISHSDRVKCLYPAVLHVQVIR